MPYARSPPRMLTAADDISSPLSRYRLEEELGRGGMGVVYRAYDRLARRYVAVKRIEADVTADVIGEQPRGQASSSAATWRLPPSHSRLRPPSSGLLAEDSGAISEAEQLRTALSREFRILASLRHPNIISVLDYGFDDYNRPVSGDGAAR